MKPSHTTTEFQLSKLSSAPTNALTGFATPPFYEPTSVLDTSFSSSPAGSDPLLDLPSLPSSEPWDLPPPPSDDWDPLSWLLDKDTANANGSAHSPPLHHPDSLDLLDASSAANLDSVFPNPAGSILLPSADQHHLPPPVFEQVHLDQLLRAAQAVESNDVDLARSILARLNHHIPVPSGRPLQRAACYFKEALLSLLDHHHQFDDPLRLPPSPVNVVRKIAAYKALSDLSPVPQFASFTANQAVLEAVFHLDASGFPRPIHLIDFDIGLGGQWSSFMHEVAARCRAARVSSPSVHITAVVPEESLETNLMADNLRDFARGLGVRFTIDFIFVGGKGLAALNAVRLASGECVAVSFTPSIFSLLGCDADSVAGFLRFIRRLMPRVVVLVDAESWCSNAGPHQFFRRSFISGLEYYSVVLESLDAAAAAGGLGDEPVRRIERALIRPRVGASVGSWSVRTLPWKEMLSGSGFKRVPFSEFTESQATWLTERVPVGGFHVARQEGSMVLSWQGRELAATSAWKC